MKAQQEEAARLEAYNTAVALAEEGQYKEAIAAFTEFGEYRDSAELLESLWLPNQYNLAKTAVDEGNYDEAYHLFMELEDYKDTQEYFAHFSYVIKSAQVSNYGNEYECKFSYDENGNLTGVEIKYGKGNGIVFEYDNRGILTGTRNRLSGETTYTYT